MEDVITEENLGTADDITADDAAFDPPSGEVDAPSEASENGDGADDCTDYEKLAHDDLVELGKIFPDARSLRSITALDNPLRYAALRDMGLSAKEAYLATQNHIAREYNNRSHLRTSVPSGAKANDGSMDAAALEEARQLFSGVSDRELQRLYKRVTK